MNNNNIRVPRIWKAPFVSLNYWPIRVFRTEFFSLLDQIFVLFSYENRKKHPYKVFFPRLSWDKQKCHISLPVGYDSVNTESAVSRVLLACERRRISAGCRFSPPKIRSRFQARFLYSSVFFSCAEEENCVDRRNYEWGRWMIRRKQQSE